MIRDANIPVNGYYWAQVKLLAEQQGIDCAETLLESWIREKLDQSPEIADLLKLRSDAKKQADAAWKAKWSKQPEDQLP